MKTILAAVGLFAFATASFAQTGTQPMPSKGPGVVVLESQPAPYATPSVTNNAPRPDSLGLVHPPRAVAPPQVLADASLEVPGVGLHPAEQGGVVHHTPRSSSMSARSR